MTEERLVLLIVGQLSGRLDAGELRELHAWAAEDPANHALMARMLDEAKLEHEMERYQAIDPIAGYNRWVSYVQRRRKIQRIRMVVWSAAACLLVAVSVVGLIRSVPGNKPHAADVAKVNSPVMPGRNTAILTLSNGRHVLLDSAATGDLAKEGNARLVKADSSSLSYQLTQGATPVTVAYNTLTTPRSGQYQVTLTDGSRVWLNNVSSLRFPTAFQGKERMVELEGGEAYFEIANDPSKPFLVKVKNETVEVLGTSFNIMAYPEESGIQTTLLTGAVKVKTGRSAVQLKPDQMAQANPSGQLHVLEGVVGEDIISWKNGFFYFGRASFSAVMRQLARWYNIDVVYEGKVPSMEFVGKIDRGLTLDELLKYLDKNQVHFRLEGRKLIVLSN